MTLELVRSESKEITPPREGAPADEWATYIEAEAAKALDEGYRRMHYFRPGIRCDLKLRRPVRRTTVSATPAKPSAQMGLAF